MTYNLTLANVVPAASAFAVRVNNTARTVSSVSVSGTKVYLNLASPVVYGDNVTVAYTKPASNPLQTTAGGQAATIGGQNVVNNCSVTPNQPPLVNISSPTKSNDFIAPALITIDAVANDPDGTIVKVEFFNGQTKLGESTSVPYSLVWKDVPAGSYIITASATDNMNAKTVSASVTVVVEKSTPAVNQSPTVTIKNPNKGEKYKKHDILILEAEASDPDGTITSVLFKNGDIIIAEVTESPYTYQWQIPDTGSFFITATAIDNLGALTESPGIDFSVFESEGSGFGIISLYPNPSDGSFSVNMSGSSEDERRFTVYNMSGQAVVNEQRPGQEVTLLFNLPELPSGTYILAISDKNKIVDSKTFIKK